MTVSVENRSKKLAIRAALLVLLPMLAGLGCAEIQKPDIEAAGRLADLRTELEENRFLVAFQKAYQTKAISKGEDPDQYDDAAKLREMPTYKAQWDRERERKFKAFYAGYQTKAGDVIRHCIIQAQHDPKHHTIDQCVKRQPQARYDPIKSAAVAIALLLLALAGVVAYRQGRRSIDVVALAGPKLGLKVNQGRQATKLEGAYKDHDIRIESSAPEVGTGDRFVRVHILSDIAPDAVVRFGPLAPPTGLELPDLEAPEVIDNRIPPGYKLRISEGASAEHLLKGDVGFQLREFDPVDVRVHDGMLTVTTWFLVGDPEEVVELVDLTLEVASEYKASGAA